MAEGVRFCPRCGTERQGALTYCGSCGLRLEPEDAPAATVITARTSAATREPHPAAASDALRSADANATGPEPRTRGGSGRSDLHSLGIAVGIVIGVFVALFTIMRVIQIPESYAGPIAAMTLTGITPVHTIVRTRVFRPTARTFTALPEGVVPEAAFRLPWVQMAVYGGLTLAGVLEGAAFVAALLFGIGGDGGEVSVFAATFVGSGAGLTASTVAISVIGRWSASRGETAQDALKAVAAAGGIGFVASFIIDAIIVGFGLDQVPLRLLIQALPWTVAAAIGLWIGRRRRHRAYLDYLVRSLPPGSVEEVVGVAYARARGTSRRDDETSVQRAEETASARSEPATWAPTHRVPLGGMRAYAHPHPAAPVVAELPERLELRLVERRADWANVRAVNGWTGWVDGRRLVSGDGSS